MTIRQKLARYLKNFSSPSAPHRCSACGRDRVIGDPRCDNTVRGMHFIPYDGGWRFPYCEECHKKLSAEEKKKLIWLLVSGMQANNREQAANILGRGDELCAQIDKGL